jgi:hypothetical protein
MLRQRSRPSGAPTLRSAKEKELAPHATARACLPLCGLSAFCRGGHGFQSRPGVVGGTALASATSPRPVGTCADTQSPIWLAIRWGSRRPVRRRFARR